MYLHKITTKVRQTLLIGEGRAEKVRTFTKVEFERAARQYEQAAKDEIQVAVADTIEHVRADLICQLVRIEQTAEIQLSTQQMTLLIGTNRASEFAVEKRRTKFGVCSGRRNCLTAIKQPNSVAYLWC